MGNQIIVRQVLAFILYVFLQIAFGKNIVLGNYAFCFPYVAFLLAIPFDLGRILYMLVAFFMGLCIDIAYNTIGFHIAACVLLAFSREYIMQLIAPTGGYEIDNKPTMQNMGTQWFLMYSLMLIFLHHTLFFLIETSNFVYWTDTLLKIISSTFFTLVIVMILQTFYTTAKRRR